MEKFFSFETVIVLAAAAVGLWLVLPFSTALVLAGISAYILHPMVSKLRRTLGWYDLALILSLLIIIAPAVLFLNYAAGDITPLINDISGITGSLKSVFDTLTVYAANYGLDHYLDNIPELIGKLQVVASAQLEQLLKNIPHIALSIVVYLFATYYLLKDGDKIGDLFTSYAKSLPRRDTEALMNLFRGIKNGFDVLFFSYVTLSLIITVLAWIGYFMLKVPYPGIFAVLTGIFAFLPLVGTWVGYGFASIYMYSHTGSIIHALAVIIYGALVLSVIPEIILKPALGSKVGEVHPLTIFLGFFGGPILFGVKGFLLGPIILVIAETVIKGYAHYNIATIRDRTRDVHHVHVKPEVELRLSEKESKEKQQKKK